MTQTILLVEDNLQLLDINQQALELAGYHVSPATSLAEARDVWGRQPVHAIVLDIMLPDGSGLDFCRELRQNSGVPILFLTALGKNSDIVKGLATGGDDYLPKPYDLTVLVARVAALLRRAGKPVIAGEICRGPLRLDVVASRAYLRGEDILLTQKEYAILLLLVQMEGQPVSAEALYESAWSMKANGDVRAVRQQVSRLRGKLGADGEGPVDIVSEYGRGYRLVVREE